MSTLIDLGRLALARPTVQSPVSEVAGWYEQKASVLHQIAAASTALAEHDRYEMFAQQAHEHAVRLLKL